MSLFSNLSPSARTLMQEALRVARGLDHMAVLPEHLLLGLDAVPTSMAAVTLSEKGFDTVTARKWLAKKRRPFSVPMKSSSVAEETWAIITPLSASQGRPIDCDDIIAAVVFAEPAGVLDMLAAFEIVPADLLDRMGVEVLPPAEGQPADAFRFRVNGQDFDSVTLPDPQQQEEPDAKTQQVLDRVEAREQEEDTPTGHPGVPNALAAFVRDLTEDADTLEPLIGRDDEVNRLVQVLSRRVKNNPVLVGDPGVGKTAIVDGLALLMADGNVPASLRDRPLWRVDLGAMVSGARFRGDFEERLTNTMKAAIRRRAVLFIDELHMISGSAGGTDPVTQPGQLLKENLARGGVSLIGATTVEEYRKHISTDSALDRRFTTIEVTEPDTEEVVEILRRVQSRYEDHHEVRYTDEAVVAAAELASQYIRDRRNPDKAIDVLDEAGSWVAMRVVDEEQLARDLEDQLGTTGSQADAHAADEVKEVDAELAEVRQHWPEVTVEDVAAVVAKLSGTEPTMLVTSGPGRLATLRESLAGRVLGQDDAVCAVARVVRRHRAGLVARTRPVSFLFAGPTGVGKTELAKALSDSLFGAHGSAQGSLIRFDMSEFSAPHEASKLFGAPPGYVGHTEGGQLTEAVRRNPASVILLDEVDKAHPSVFDALLQVLDDGRMRDGQGRLVSFADAIVVMTTNFGSAEASRNRPGFGKQNGQDADAVTWQVLRQSFRPEFLNRLDEVLVFSSLTDQALREIADAMVAEVIEAAGRHGVVLRVGEKARAELVAQGTDPAYGARPLRRTIDRLVVDPLTDLLLDTSADELARVEARVNSSGQVTLVPVRPKSSSRLKSRRPVAVTA